MIRLYGNAPYKVAFIHGGPGDIGSLKICAEEWQKISGMGTMEPLQSKYTISELIEELYVQIKENSSSPVSFIGHSWGALLATLFAKKHPELSEKLILVGCPPIEDEYVEEISKRRLQNLSHEDALIFQRLIDHIATDEDMKEIPKILDTSDNYCSLDSRQTTTVKTDSRMYNAIWDEVSRLRTAKILLSTFKGVKCPIYFIQGATDPHPIDGVIVPLKKIGVLCEVHILDKCGHSPFIEKYAKDKFYKILFQILQER